MSETSALRAPLQRVAGELNWRSQHQVDTTVILGTRALPVGVAPMQFLNDEQGLLRKPMPISAIDTVADQIARVQQELSGQGIALAFAAAPDKSTIYRERLPAGRTYRTGFIERLYAALRQRNVPLIDLATGLRCEALRHPAIALFYSTDTHWNPRGQAMAARIIADSLRRWQGRAKALKESDHPGPGKMALPATR